MYLLNSNTVLTEYFMSQWRHIDQVSTIIEDESRLYYLRRIIDKIKQSKGDNLIVYCDPKITGYLNRHYPNIKFKLIAYSNPFTTKY